MGKIQVLLAVFVVSLAVLNASAKPSQSNQYLQGTVLRVDRHESAQRVAGENPSDAPLADPAVFAYDIGVKVGCNSYVGRYQSWYDYVPSVFKTNQKIQLRISHSVMHVNVPNEKEVELNIVSKHAERGPCANEND